MTLTQWIEAYKQKRALKRKAKRFKMAKKLAHRLTDVYNRRFYIFLENEQYTVLSKNQLEMMKKQGTVAKKANSFEYMKQCVYYTN